MACEEERRVIVKSSGRDGSVHSRGAAGGSGTPRKSPLTGGEEGCNENRWRRDRWRKREIEVRSNHTASSKLTADASATETRGKIAS